MTKLTAAHRRVLCDLIGERFDSPEPGFYRSLRSFTTGNDMVAVKEALEKNKEWWDFYGFCLHSYVGSVGPDPTFAHFTAWLLQPERFCFLAAEWKIQQKGDK